MPCEYGFQPWNWMVRFYFKRTQLSVIVNQHLKIRMKSRLFIIELLSKLKIQAV